MEYRSAIGQKDRLAYKAAKAAGDQAAMAAIRADVKRRQASLNRSIESIDKDKERYDPTRGMSGVEKFRAGTGAGLMNVARQGAALLTPDSLTPEFASEAARKRAEETDSPLDATGAGAAGKFFGEMVATAPLGGAVGSVARGGRVLRGLAKGADEVGALRRGLSYAAEGGTTGALTADDGGTSGAVTAIPATFLLNRVGRLLSAAGTGMNRTKAAQRMLDMGADLTPGQMNPHGAWASIEGAAESAPFGAGRGLAKARATSMRSVVPNAAADIVGAARPGSKSARAGVGDALTVPQKVFQETSSLPNGKPRPIDPAELGRMRSDSAMRADEARIAKLEGKGEEMLAQADLTANARRARYKAKVAERLARKSPTEKNKVYAAAATARADKLDNIAAGRGPVQVRQAGAEAARTRIDEQVPEMMKDLHSTLNASLARHGFARESEIGKLVSVQARNVLRSKDVPTIQKALSVIRTKKHQFRYSGKDANDFNAAKVMDDVENWFEQKLSNALPNQGMRDRLATANRQYSQLSPMMGALKREGQNPEGLVSGEGLEKAVLDNMTDPGFASGKGSKLLRTAGAMREVEQLSKHSALQGAALPTVFRLAQSVPGAIGGVKAVRRVAQGNLGYQRQIRKLTKTKAGRALIRSMEALRTGVIGASQ